MKPSRALGRQIIANGIKQSQSLTKIALEIKDLKLFNGEKTYIFSDKRISTYQNTPICIECQDQQNALIMAYLLFFFNKQYKVLSTQLNSQQDSLCFDKFMACLKSAVTSNCHYFLFDCTNISSNSKSEKIQQKSQKISQPLFESFNKNLIYILVNSQMIKKLFNNLDTDPNKCPERLVQMMKKSLSPTMPNSKKNKQKNKNKGPEIKLLASKTQQNIKIYQFQLEELTEQKLIIVCSKGSTLGKDKQRINQAYKGNKQCPQQEQSEQKCMIFLFPNQESCDCFINQIETSKASQTAKDAAKERQEGEWRQDIKPQVKQNQQSIYKINPQIQIKQPQLIKEVPPQKQRLPQIVKPQSKVTSSYSPPRWIIVLIAVALLITLGLIYYFKTNQQPYQFVKQLLNILYSWVKFGKKRLLRYSTSIK